MTNSEEHHVSPAEQDLVLASLEPGQLVAAKKHHIPRRKLRGPELAVVWTLRLYLIFMTLVVAYQVWLAAH
jgi:hypothetical protein